MNVRRPESENVPALAVEGVRASQICDAITYRQADLHSMIDHASSGSNAFISFAALTAHGSRSLKQIYTHAPLERVRSGFLPSRQRPIKSGYQTSLTIAQRFLVHSDKAEYEKPQIFAATKDKLEKNYLGLRGSPMSFVIVLLYPSGAELRMPVEKNDAIQPEKAVLPKGYSIRQQT